MSDYNKNKIDGSFFEAVNYYLMLAGLLFIILGVVLMVGGGSDDPSLFNEEEIYSFRRITVVPILMILGFVVEVVAILYRRKSS